MKSIKIRYNPESGINGPDFWKVIIDEVEHLASDVIINVPCRTTMDPVGDSVKFNVSCLSKNIVWKDKVVVIS